MACEVGLRRHMEAIKSGRRDRHGAKSDDFGTGLVKHIDGAGGELAFAKARNLYWDGSVNTFKTGGDVGLVQVRTRREQHYDLLVRDDDRDEDWFVLVIGKMPEFRVVGCIRASDAKRPEFRKNFGGHGAAFFVPQAVLRPLPART